MLQCRTVSMLMTAFVLVILSPHNAPGDQEGLNSVDVKTAQEPAEIEAAGSSPGDQPFELASESAWHIDLAADTHSASTFELPGPVLTLPDALAQALQSNPVLTALDYETQAAEERVLQGSFKPNPELDAEISQFLGTAEMRLFRSATTGVGISQLIERGQKRCARMAVAEREGDVVRLEKERAKLDIMLGVSRAYYNVLIAQEELRLAAEREELAQQVYDVVELKVEAGKAAQLELSRVKLDQVNAQIDREQAQQAFDSARKLLAAQWGGDPAEFGSVEGQLALPLETPDMQQLESLLTGTPEIQRWQAEEALRQAKLDMACAEGVPDLTISGGIERFEDTDSLGFRVGISVPLPTRNRNEGNIGEAQAYVEQTESLRQADLLKARQELTAIYADLVAAYNRASKLQAEVLPAAQDTFELTNYGYRFGKFGMLEVLDAERTLVEARSQFLEALADYQLAAVELERLIAQPLDSLSNAEQPDSHVTPTTTQEATGDATN